MFCLVTSDLTLSAHCLEILQQRRHCCTCLTDRFVTLRSKHAATCHPPIYIKQTLHLRVISNQVQSDVLVCSPGLQVSEATKSPDRLWHTVPANSSLAVLTCIQVSRLLYNQVLRQGFMSAAGTPAGGRHCDSRETAGLTDCAAGKAGCENALPFLRTWLEQLQEAILSTHPTAQNFIGPASWRSSPSSALCPLSACPATHHFGLQQEQLAAQSRTPSF